MPFIVWISLSCIVLLLFYRACEKKEDALVKDEKKAMEVLNLFKEKCENRKALMIAGEWGYGKTSFYKASLKPVFEKEFENYSIVEISCFGIKKLDDLVVDILNKTLFIEWYSIFWLTIKQILSSSIGFKKQLIPQNLLIIIDDFERSKLDHIELLGFIDYLIHQKNSHIIILCNEEKISHKKYREFREKTIEKYKFELTVDFIEKILGSNRFVFKNKEYQFNKHVIDKLILLIEKIKNIRLAFGSCIDLIKISNKLIEAFDKARLDEAEKEDCLRLYFNGYFTGIIKPVFIKNAHTEDVYFRCRQDIEKDVDSIIKDDFLRKLIEVNLGGYDTCTPHSLFLDDTCRSFLEKGIGVFDAEFCDALVEGLLCENIALKAGVGMDVQVLFEKTFNFILTSQKNGCSDDRFYLLFLFFLVERKLGNQELFDQYARHVGLGEIVYKAKNMKKQLDHSWKLLPPNWSMTTLEKLDPHLTKTKKIIEKCIHGNFSIT